MNTPSISLLITALDQRVFCVDLLYTELVSQQTHSYHKINISFIGHPITPMFGELISGPSAGEVTIMIKTVAFGLDDPSQVFWFVITPYTDSTEGETISSQTIRVVLSQR